MMMALIAIRARVSLSGVTLLQISVEVDRGPVLDYSILYTGPSMSFDVNLGEGTPLLAQGSMLKQSRLRNKDEVVQRRSSAWDKLAALPGALWGLGV